MLIESNESQPDPQVVKQILERDYSGGFNRDEVILISSHMPSWPETIIRNEVHSVPWKVSDLDFHYKGETPRGTKPARIGGVKKSKQQRKAMKARRKQ